MAKKSKPAGGSIKSKGSLSAVDHRKLSMALHAKARIHDAQADLIEAKNPPKRSTRGYPC